MKFGTWLRDEAPYIDGTVSPESHRSLAPLSAPFLNYLAEMEQAIDDLQREVEELKGSACGR
jgi:hypothetical protein